MPTKCVWEFDYDETYSWITSCGKKFYIVEGTPVENEMKFCPYCGKKIVTRIYQDKGEQNAD